jgi:exonuclease SbcD
VPAALFENVSYTALGHLHGRATLDETVRYSGSPLAYSFSEARHTKGMWLVELGRDGVCATTFVEAPVPRPLSTLTGDLESLLIDPRHDPVCDHWLHVTLTDPVRPTHPMERLRARFPHTLVLAFAPAGEPAPSLLTGVPTGPSDHRVALDFVEEMRGAPATDAESDLLLEACDACVDDPDADLLVTSPAGSG